MTNLTRGFRAGLLACVLACSGCLTIDHGVVDTPLPNDRRLVGAWSTPDEREIHIFVETSPTQMVIQGFDRQRCAEKAGERLVATRTEIGGRSFLDLSEDSVRVSAAKRLAGFMAYEFDSAGHLIVSIPDPDVFRRAVETGELAGAVTDPNDKPGTRLLDLGPEVQVSDSTARLRTYLETHPEAMEQIGSFTRLDRAPAATCQE